MSKLPLLSAKQLIKILKKMSFTLKRQKGSHAFFEHPDGRTTLVACHQGEVIDRGLLNKIIKHDLKITREDFINYT